MLFAALLSGMLMRFGATTLIQSGVCHQITQPALTQPLDGTETSIGQISVSGTTGSNGSVRILDNGQSVAMTSGDSLGNYSVSVPLVANQNTILTQAYNPCDQTSDSQSTTVQYNVPPQPVASISQVTLPWAAPPNSKTIYVSAVVEPASNPSSTSAQPSLTAEKLILSTKNLLSYSTAFAATDISGMVNIPATITTSDNDHTVAAFTSGANTLYQVLVPLDIGQNSVTITAKNAAQTASLQFHVTRSAPAVQPQTVWSSAYVKLIAGGVGMAAATLFIFEGKGLLIHKRWR